MHGLKGIIISLHLISTPISLFFFCMATSQFYHWSFSSAIIMKSEAGESLIGPKLPSAEWKGGFWALVYLGKSGRVAPSDGFYMQNSRSFRCAISFNTPPSPRWKQIMATAAAWWLLSIVLSPTRFHNQVYVAIGWYVRTIAVYLRFQHGLCVWSACSRKRKLARHNEWTDR